MRQGFTLIEMLIVLTIIAVLAVVSVSSYDVVRRQARLQVIGDTLVSTLKEQQNLARSGKTSALDALSTDRQLMCHGMRFEKNGAVEVVEAPFVGVDTTIRSDKSNFCLMNKAKKTPMTLQEKFSVVSLDRYGTPVDTLAVMFTPPFGDTLIGLELDTDGLLPPDSGTTKPEICVGVSPLQLAEKTFLQFDIVSGRVTRVNSCS